MGVRDEHFEKMRKTVDELVNEIASETCESRWYIARLIELEAVNFQRRLSSSEHGGTR